MFTESYKKDNEKLQLSDDFLNQLAKDMKASDKEPTNQTISFNAQENKATTARGKFYSIHTLATVLCACLVLVCLTAIVNFASKNGNKGSSSEYDYLMIESAANDEIDESSEEFMDETAMNETTTTTTTTDSSVVESESESLKSSTASGTSQEINLTSPDDFVPSDPGELQSTIDQLKSYPIGTDMVQIDYYDTERIILHDYWGLLVYDLKKESIVRAINFKDTIGTVTIQGDHAIQVKTYTGGNYVLLETNWANRALDDVCYIYNVQTDELLSFTYAQLDEMKQTEFALLTTCDSSHFASYITYGIDNITAYKSEENNTEFALFYQCTEDSSIASLSLITITDPLSGTSAKIQPIFGENAITDLISSGYSMNGYAD